MFIHLKPSRRKFWHNYTLFFYCYNTSQSSLQGLLDNLLQIYPSKKIEMTICNHQTDSPLGLSPHGDCSNYSFRVHGNVACNILLHKPTCQTVAGKLDSDPHCTKKPVTTILTYPWKCTVLHCNHLGNIWKPLVLMTRHFDYCPSASECWVISTSGFQVFPRWLQCKTVHFQG